MTENEALKILDIEKQCLNKSSSGQCKIRCADCKMNIPITYQEKAIKVAIAALKEIQQYREIGTVEECREAVEKQKPKKPHRNYEKFSGLWCKCGWYLGQKRDLGIKYCPNCGQAIDVENLEVIKEGLNE